MNTLFMRHYLAAVARAMARATRPFSLSYRASLVNSRGYRSIDHTILLWLFVFGVSGKVASARQDISPDAEDSGHAWLVKFDNGNVNHNHHDNQYCVRLVRGV